MLDDPTYISGLQKDHFSRSSENVIAFSLGCASLEIQQFLSYVIKPQGISIPPKIYHFIDGTLEDNEKVKCVSNCIFMNDYLSKGDSANISVTDRHIEAEEKRKDRQSTLRKLKTLAKKLSYMLLN